MNYPLSFQLSVIDQFTTFSYLLQYRVSDYSDLNPHSYTPNSSVYCPFHPNTRTKSAKLYPKEDSLGSEKLFCFSENRLFYPHSLLTPPKTFTGSSKSFYSIIPYDPYWVFSAIWKLLSEQDRESLLFNSTEFSTVGKTSNIPYPLYHSNSIDLFTLLTYFKENK